MSIRQNVRNFLVGLTISEVRTEWAMSIDMGQTVRAKYVEEFLRELEEEDSDDDDWDAGDDCIAPAAYF